jgi:hypothetical protein
MPTGRGQSTEEPPAVAHLQSREAPRTTFWDLNVILPYLARNLILLISRWDQECGTLECTFVSQ